MRIRLSLSLAALLAVLLTACSGGGAGGASAEPTEAAASCTDVQEVEIEEAENYHVDREFTAADYATNPPAGGEHSLGTVSGGQSHRDANIGDAVHSLDHGLVIVWTNGLEGDEADLIETTSEELWADAYEIVVAVVEYPDLEVPLAVSSWGRLQTCTRVDAEAAAAVADFVEQYHAMSPEGEAICQTASFLGETIPPNCE